MKRTVTFTFVIAILAFFLMAQKAESEMIVHGTAFQQTLIPVGGGDPGCWWCIPNFEYIYWEAPNELINLEWFNPESGRWQLIADDRTNVHGQFFFDIPPPPLELSRLFRVYIPGNWPSEEFHWFYGEPPFYLDYYFWF